MGGRGASSGMSYDKYGKPKNKYGTQYHTLLEKDNIKFVSKNTRSSEALMETMTQGRVYVEVGGEDLLRIIQFDENNKRNYVLERDKRTDEWHAHKGYLHSEKGLKHEKITKNDKKIIEKVQKIWYDNKGV